MSLLRFRLVQTKVYRHPYGKLKVLVRRKVVMVPCQVDQQTLQEFEIPLPFNDNFSRQYIAKREVACGLKSFVRRGGSNKHCEHDKGLVFDAVYARRSFRENPDWEMDCH